MQGSESFRCQCNVFNEAVSLVIELFKPSWFQISLVLFVWIYCLVFWFFLRLWIHVQHFDKKDLVLLQKYLFLISELSRHFYGQLWIRWEQFYRITATGGASSKAFWPGLIPPGEAAIFLETHQTHESRSSGVTVLCCHDIDHHSWTAVNANDAFSRKSLKHLSFVLAIWICMQNPYLNF